MSQMQDRCYLFLYGGSGRQRRATALIEKNVPGVGESGEGNQITGEMGIFLTMEHFSVNLSREPSLKV